MTRTCPICNIQQNADELAFQYHVNSHFDDNARDLPKSGPCSPRKRRMSGMKEREEYGLADEGDELLPDDATCPLCSFPFAGATGRERDQHVNACMDSAASESRPPSVFEFETTHSTHSGPYIPPDPWQDLSSSFLLSDQIIQQSIAQTGSASAGSLTAEGWDGPAKPGGWNEWRGRKVEKGDKWWNPIKGDIGDVPDNFSPGLLPVLQQLLESSVHKGNTRRAVLSREAISITGAFRFDLTWGCGYRNALMLISSILLHSPSLAPLFSRENNGADPGVRRLQGWLDEAWANGFDPVGKAHFSGKVLGGRKWIGTGDLYAFFSYKGVPCDLYDFPKPLKSGDRPAHKALTEWVKAYYDEGLGCAAALGRTSAAEVRGNVFDQMMQGTGGNRGSAIKRIERYPLILQHNGHSRTIVGYEETTKGEINLLLFDPGKTVPAKLRQAGLRYTASHRPSPPSSRPTIKPNIKKPSHESIPFSPPYTNGASEFTQWRDVDQAFINPPSGQTTNVQRLEGGTSSINLEEDEEMHKGGWVRKKIQKLTKGDSAGMSALGKPKKVKVGEGDGGKGLAYFRVNLSSLGKEGTYQVLAINGDEPLTLSQQSGRKYVRSLPIR